MGFLEVGKSEKRLMDIRETAAHNVAKSPEAEAEQEAFRQLVVARRGHREAVRAMEETHDGQVHRIATNALIKAMEIRSFIRRAGIVVGVAIPIIFWKLQDSALFSEALKHDGDASSIFQKLVVHTLGGAIAGAIVGYLTGTYAADRYMQGVVEELKDEGGVNENILSKS